VNVTQNIVTMTIFSQCGSIFMSSFKNERKSLKINKALVPHFLLLLPAVPHPLLMLPADLPALSLKEWVQTPVKVKKVQAYS